MTGKRVVLPDGSAVLTRPVRADDAPLLADGFSRLSAESRRLRFLTGKAALTGAELEYFTKVDHHDHEALGALQPDDGRGVGIARYIRLADDPDAAEVAVTVVDDWQGRGLGTELLIQLTDRARQEGIRRFTALVAADNAAVVGLLHDLGAQVRAVHAEYGAVEYEIELPTTGLGATMRDLFAAFSRRQLVPPTPIREVLADLVPPRFTIGDASLPGARSTAATAARAGPPDVAGAEASVTHEPARTGPAGDSDSHGAPEPGSGVPR